MPNSPIIGLTMRLELETNRFYLGRDYSEALEYFGAVPLHIPLIPNRHTIKELVKNLDGILLPGSDSDIDPSHYSEDPHPFLKKVVPEKDLTDLLILEEAEKLNLPVLAICFGMQALNVHKGGSLIQDIGSQIKNPIKHEQGLPLDRLSHNIKVKNRSRLSSYTKQKGLNGNIKVNSHHHQSVKEVGKNLTATAWTNDGMIECIEGVDKNRFVLGLQWHPEISFKNDPLSREIFKAFVEECRKFATNRGRFSE
ncbi:gamma-glutamyl-gamma-aminobutyrate hydrolase family protein [soil metagenome]